MLTYAALSPLRLSKAVEYCEREREKEREMLAVLANPEITQMLVDELWYGRVC
jgi:hypothetical protein